MSGDGYQFADYYERAADAVAAMIETNMSVFKREGYLAVRAMMTSFEFHESALDLAIHMMLKEEK
jgi:hypothetical protein